MLQLRYADETYQARRLLFQVRNELKLGWSEEVYHQAFLELAIQNAIPVLSKPRSWLTHRNQQVHCFEPDLILWDTIILEFKALAYTKRFAGKHYAQLIHYLKFWDKTLGLLINFGATPIAIERVLWDEKEFRLQENYEAIRKHVSFANRDLLNQIRDAVIYIAHQFGFGYPDTVYRRLLAIEFVHTGLQVIEETVVPAKISKATVVDMDTQHILVDGQVLIHVRSLLDQPSGYDYAQTKNYLKHLDLTMGLIINFSREQLQIHAVSHK